jgi:hypothetical protein
MEYLRIFSQSHTNWLNRSPPLTQLLSCFSVDPNQAIDRQVNRTPSVFAARNWREELQNIAAHFQKDPTEVEKQFAIRIRRADCAAAGIIIDPAAGNTGVSVG